MDFNKHQVVSCFVNTLDNNADTRQKAESWLVTNLKTPHFLEFLMSLTVDQSVDGFIRLSAVLFVKNSIRKCWLLRSHQTGIVPAEISSEDKLSLKGNLLAVLNKAIEMGSSGQNEAIVTHLTSIVSNFLGSSENEGNVFGKELLLAVENLVNTSKSSNDVLHSSHLMTALLVTRELTKHYRWSIQGFNLSANSKVKTADQINDSTLLMDKLTMFMSPILLDIAGSILTNISNEANFTDQALDHQFHLLYLILKIFKYTIFNDLPEYLLTVDNDKYVHMDSWTHLLLSFFSISFPSHYTPSVVDFRVKCQKWAIANLVRIFTKYGGGRDQIDSNYLNINFEQHVVQLKQYKQYFKSAVLAQVLNTCFNQISLWHENKTHLFNSSLYYFIQFFYSAISDESIYSTFLAQNISVLFQYLIFPVILLSDENLESFQDDDEEFFRKFYDLTSDDHRADTSAINFLYRLSNSYYVHISSWLLGFIDSVFAKRRELISSNAQAHEKLQNAKETEAALRVLGILAYHITTKEVSNSVQIDSLIQSYMLPEILDHQFLWLCTRSLETLATFNYEFQDLNVLSEVFKGVMDLLGDNLEGETSFLVQLEALDVLRSLLINKDIKEYLKNIVNSIVSKLLHLISEYEVDFLTTILVEFITAFSHELKPFANELSIKLSQQFLKIANELSEACANRMAYQDSNGEDIHNIASMTAVEDDKESQCIGIIENLTVMAETMNGDKLLMIQFLVNFDPCVKFVIQNTVVVLLEECVTLCTTFMRSLGRVTRSVQNNLDYILDNFNSLGFNEYFDFFGNFFESYVMINYAYKLVWERSFNEKLQLEVSNESNPLRSFLNEAEVELKNVLEIDKFTLDSDQRLLALIKLTIVIANQSIMDGDYRGFNSCITLLEDAILVAHNASLLKGVQNSEMDHVLKLENVNDDNLQENQVLQSILECALNGFLNTIFGSLQNVVLLTEEGADLSFVDFDIVQLVNNFLKLVFCAFFYKPVLTIQVVNNFNEIDNLLDLIGKVDDTNSDAVDELPAEVALQTKSLKFFQLINRVYLTFNTNNSFLKMSKNNSFSIKLSLLTMLKLERNFDRIKEVLQLKDEVSSNWLSIWLQKLYVKMIKVTCDIVTVYQAEKKEEEEVDPVSHFGEDEFEYFDEEDLSSLGVYKQNEQMRLQLINFGNFGVGTEPSLKITQIFHKTLIQVQQDNPRVYSSLMEYIDQRSLSQTIEDALSIDREGYLANF